MMNKALQPFNTFGIDAKVNKLVQIRSEKQLQLFLKENQSASFRILGGGSNILLLKNTYDTVLKIEIPSITIERTFKKEVYVSAGAGVVWHHLVLFAVRNDLGGLENLSWIPGTVGAAPIQNIGAYGVELKDVFHQLRAIEIATGKVRIFTKQDCQFGYRNSIFKNALKGKYIIARVWFKLSKAPHQLSLSYGAIKQILKEKGIAHPTIQELSNIVTYIRKSKLPDPQQIGNAGSFFKNPVLNAKAFKNIQQKFPAVPHYPAENGQTKIAAAWLIEMCGWKGKVVGNTGTHAHQSLVLVNHGNASGVEIYNLAKQIVTSVREKFNIELEMEVNIWK